MPDPERLGAVPEISAPVKVWDAQIRLFHWLVVALLGVSFFTADRGLMKWHRASGLGLLTLVIFRIGWGFLGSTTARFSEFVRGPRQVVNYFIGMKNGHGRAYTGHNPAGGWMVVVLLVALLAQASTGLFANDGVHFEGPLAYLITAELSDRVTKLHGILFDLILVLAWVHVVAVLFYFFVKGDNLIVPMLSGMKNRANVPIDARVQFTRPWVAWLLMAGVAGCVWWIVH